MSELSSIFKTCFPQNYRDGADEKILTARLYIFRKVIYIIFFEDILSHNTIEEEKTTTWIRVAILFSIYI